MSFTLRRILPILLILAFGLLTGCALPGLLRMGSGEYAGLASRYAFRVYEEIEVDSWDLLRYVVSVRLPVLVILWLSSFTTIGIVFHLGYAWWVITSGAMLLSLFGQNGGFEGIRLFLCCLFPQWIFYAILWKREYLSWISREKYATEALQASVKKIRRDDLAEFASLAAICVTGCASEAFLGTWILKLYLQL